MEETNQEILETEDQEVESIETDDSDIEQTLDDVQAEIEDDSEEIEFNSQSYKLPKEIAEAVKGMQKDYTVKTQHWQEQRRDGGSSSISTRKFKRVHASYGFK